MQIHQDVVDLEDPGKPVIPNKPNTPDNTDEEHSTGNVETKPVGDNQSGMDNEHVDTSDSTNVQVYFILTLLAGGVLVLYKTGKTNK